MVRQIGSIGISQAAVVYPNNEQPPGRGHPRVAGVCSGQSAARRPIFPLNELRHTAIMFAFLAAVLAGWLAPRAGGWLAHALLVAAAVVVIWGTLVAVGIWRETDGDGRLNALGSAIVLALIGWPMWHAARQLDATDHSILAGIVWFALALYALELVMRLGIFAVRLVRGARA